jgi:hypothetical protein
MTLSDCLTAYLHFDYAHFLYAKPINEAFDLESEAAIFEMDHGKAIAGYLRVGNCQDLAVDRLTWFNRRYDADYKSLIAEWANETIAALNQSEMPRHRFG